MEYAVPVEGDIAPLAKTARDPLDELTYDELAKKHPEYIYWEYPWSNFRLLYTGGEQFLRAAGQQAATRAQATSISTTPIDLLANRNRRRRFLFQLEGESDTKYISRWERAYFIGYFGAIVDYFRHWLYSQPPKLRPAEGKTVPDWSAPFFGNADGAGHTLLDFSKDSFLDVLLVRRGGWLIGRPSLDVGAMSQKQAEDAGLGTPILTAYGAEEILDWSEDERGDLEWIVLRKKRDVRRFPEDRVELDTFTYVDRTRWRAWEHIPGPDRQHGLRVIADGLHNLGTVPFIRTEIPFGLWAANKLASWQIDLFNQMSMLSYGTLLSCFLQPFLKTNEPDASNRVFGEGELLELRAGRGDDPGEEFGWVGPQTNALEFQAKRLIELRDEGYRIVHQMSLAVDSQAIGAIARSGASKIEDRRASEIILQAYGGYVRDALVRTLNLISKIMGDGVKWSCDGFDNFQVSSLEEELQTAALVQTFKIQSKTFSKEIQKQVAERVLGHVDQETKQQVYDEIDEGVETEGIDPASGVAAGGARDPGVPPAPPAPPKLARPPGPAPTAR